MTWGTRSRRSKITPVVDVKKTFPCFFLTITVQNAGHQPLLSDSEEEDEELSSLEEKLLELWKEKKRADEKEEGPAEKKV